MVDKKLKLKLPSGADVTLTEPKFNNKPSEHIVMKIGIDDKKLYRNIWVSRAPAVVGIIFAFGLEGGARVLTIKRSKKMQDEPLKFGAPSGYLDWNETGYEGMTREVYEETSMYLPYYDQFLIFDNEEQPFYVQTDPRKDKHQNVSLSYVLVYDFTGHEEFFPTDIEKFSCFETEKVSWLKLTDLYNSNREWAFHHDHRIKTALSFYNEKGVR